MDFTKWVVKKSRWTSNDRPLLVLFPNPLAAGPHLTFKVPWGACLPIAHCAAVPCVRGGRRETRLLARAEVVADGSTVFTDENTTMMMAVVIVL